jgi:hypothetical protein
MPFLAQSPNLQLRHDPTKNMTSITIMPATTLQLSPQTHAYEAPDTAYDYDPLART